MAMTRNNVIESIIEDSVFAKIVETANGSAIMIGGLVIQTDCDDDVTEAIVRALRRGGEGEENGFVGNLNLNAQYAGAHKI